MSPYDDVHNWLMSTGFDLLPPEWLIHYVGGTLVLDTGDYRPHWTTAG
nr:hypothetical protein [Kibdelosporangium sp. MJ126-NF4]